MKHLFLLVILVPTLFFSCTKCDDKNNIIIEPIYISELNLPKERKYIIESLPEAIDSLGFVNNSTIDFNNYSILYQYADGNGKGISISNNVIKDDINKKYIFTTCIKVRHISLLKVLAYNNEAVLVPKIPTGYTVDFIIKK